jgi:hypothetical protein
MRLAARVQSVSPRLLLRRRLQKRGRRRLMHLVLFRERLLILCVRLLFLRDRLLRWRLQKRGQRFLKHLVLCHKR